MITRNDLFAVIKSSLECSGEHVLPFLQLNGDQAQETKQLIKADSYVTLLSAFPMCEIPKTMLKACFSAKKFRNC